MRNPLVSTRRRSWQVFGAVGTAVVAVLTGPIQAQNINWDAGAVPGNNLWTDPANWAGDFLPDMFNTAVFNVNTATTISLNNTTQQVYGLLFNQASAYTLTNGSLVLNQADQTGNANNQVQVSITTGNSGTDMLSSNVTQNSLQLQQKVTSGGITKMGGGTLRLGTSGTNFDNAINGDIWLNGGTLQAAAVGTTTAGTFTSVNNPLGGAGKIIIGASGTTLSLTAQGNFDFGREVLAGSNSFTLNGNAAAADNGDFQMRIGKISIGTATLTASTGAGYLVRTAELALDPGSTTTITANNFFYVDKLTGDATTKIVKNGGSDLRISGNAANATGFAGDIDVSAGWLVLEAQGGNQPLGNADTQINITASTPTVSLRADDVFAFQGVNINAGDNSFNLDARRLSGSNTGKVLTGGMVTIGNATMSMTGDQGFQGRLAGVSVNKGATTVINVNNNGSNAGGNHLRIDALKGDATTTVRKDGGQTLFISAGAPEFFGNLILNGGTTQVEADGATNVLTNVPSITFTNGSTLNIRSEKSSDFNANIKFGPGVITSTINADRISGGTGTGQTFTFKDVNPTGGTLTISSGNSYAFTVGSISVDAGATGTLNVGTSGVLTANGLNLPAGSIFNKIGGNTLKLATDNSATAAGAINLRNGTITASVPGALGTGLVTVGNTAMTSDGFITDQSRLNWDAAGASAKSSGVDAIAVAGGAIDLNVTPGAGDVFEIRADGRIQGTGAQLGGLTVGGNLTLAPNAIVVHEQPGATTGTVVGLSNNADLFYGLAGNAASLPVIGAGTPWKGISADNTTRTIQGADAANPAVISINGGDNNPNTIEATFQGMFDSVLSLGTSTANDGTVAWASTAAGGEKVTLAIRGTLGTSGLGRVPGGRVAFYDPASVTNLDKAVDKIIVQGGSLLLMTTGTLGGVPVDILDGASLDINNMAGNLVDGDVNVKSGGVFYFNDNQVLAGTGKITIEQGGKLDITGSAPANILTQSKANGQPINFTGSGHTVRFSANEIGELDLTVPDAGVTYVVSGGAATTGNFPETTIGTPTLNTQSAGLTLENGTLTNDGSNRAFAGPIKLNNTNLTVAASRNTSFIVTSTVSTTGNVNVGSLTAIDSRDKSTNSGNLTSLGKPDPYNSPAQVIFTGSFAANNVTANNSHLAFENADTTITNDLIINGGVLYLDGGGPSAGTQGQLTQKLADGTLAKRIILGNYSRGEMKLNLASDSNATVLNINQAFVINGDVNPQDNRSFWVSRNSGSNNRVNFNDITLNAGATLGFQEDNTDIRAALKVAGDATVVATSSNTPFDYLSVSRDASLPAFDGSNPVVLTQGRINGVGIQGYNSANSNVFGKIGAGVQIDIVRGQLFFQPGSSLDGVVRTQTAVLGGDSFVLSTSNGATSDTSIGGTGRIELGRSGVNGGTPEDFEIRGTEVGSGTAPLHTHTGEIRVVDDGTSAVDGIIRANRHNDSTVTARVKVDNVTLAAGAGVQFTSSNAIPLIVDKVSLLGSTGTIETAATGITINTVNAGTNAVTFTGAAAPTVVNPVTAGQVNVSAGSVTFNGSVTASQLNITNGSASFAAGANGPLSVSSGSATVTGNVGGKLDLASSSANITGNVTGGLDVKFGNATFNPGSGKTATVSGPTSLDAGTVMVSSGTLDFGTNVITSTAGTQTVAGLREQKVTGNAFDLGTQNTSSIVKLGPVMAQTTAGWGTNETYIYTGQFFVPNNGNGEGSFAFAENFDDSVYLAIDGTPFLNNRTWNDATGTGVLTLGAGWHDIEIRLGQGTGGAGPNNADGWNTNLGLGLDMTGEIDGEFSSPTQANFIAPLDNGMMNLFRTTVSSGLSVAANATLKAGGFKNVGRVVFSGNNSAITLDTTGAAVESSADEIALGFNVTGTLNVARAVDTVTARKLSVDGSFVKAGAGTLRVTGEGDSDRFGSIDVRAGALIMNGSIAGSVTVGNGAVLGGRGTVGTISLNGGILAPGDVFGNLKTTDLSLNGGNITLEIGGLVAGTLYDQISVSNSVSLTADTSLTLSLGFSPAIGSQFTIINNDGFGSILSGTARLSFGGTALNEGDLLKLDGGAQFRISYVGGAGGNDVVLTTVIPEPGAFASLMGGVGALLGLQRFRRRK